jgi:hypothetical protein
LASRKLDEQTFALLRGLQVQGASGLALELISPQLDGIPDPNARLKFASILFDMMHIRGRYADAAELIRQELALYPPNAEMRSPLLLPLKTRFIHHQMFYRPVTELWSQMGDFDRTAQIVGEFADVTSIGIVTKDPGSVNPRPVSASSRLLRLLPLSVGRFASLRFRPKKILRAIRSPYLKLFMMGVQRLEMPTIEK